MKYQGSKKRIGKEIFNLIYKQNPDVKVWIEPFVGGGNMIEKIPSHIYRIGFDNNKYLIGMFNAVKDGWIPPENISEKEYKEIKESINDEYQNFPLIGFVGIGCSFAGKWFGGYARGGTRNYCAESKRNLLKQKELIKDVEFYYGNYRSALSIPNTCKTVIYCDPPYKNTTKYHQQFNHEEFWEWCDLAIEYGFKVYVSEYNAPKDWKCVWSKEIISDLDLNTEKKKSIEKLFTK